jgi:hypothetical protein
MSPSPHGCYVTKEKLIAFSSTRGIILLNGNNQLICKKPSVECIDIDSGIRGKCPAPGMKVALEDCKSAGLSLGYTLDFGVDFVETSIVRHSHDHLPCGCFVETFGSKRIHYNDSSTCLSTPPGYRSICSVDQCAEGTDTCHADATCTNAKRTYTCECKPGYYGDGVSCTDNDECTEGTDICHADATCTNAKGTYTCECKPGYTCECKPGYYGDGLSCTDTDDWSDLS